MAVAAILLGLSNLTRIIPVVAFVDFIFFFGAAFIGKYDLSLRLSFLLHFRNKLSENNNFDVKNERKFLILRG